MDVEWGATGGVLWSAARREAAGTGWGGLVLLVVAGPLAAQRVEPGTGDEMTMPQVVRAALSSSREIRQARYALEEAEGQVSEAWGSVYPVVDFSADYVRNVSPAMNFVPAIFLDPNAGPDELIPVQFGTDNVWATSINVDQPVFNARSFIGVGAAGRYRSLHDEVLRDRTQAVVTRVRVRYYDLLLAQEQERLIQNSVRRVRESLAQTRALYRAGLASEYEVLRLEVELANLEPNLLRAGNAVTQARRQLAVELDAENGESLRVAGSLAAMVLDDLAANTPANRTILEFTAVSEPAATGVEALVQEALAARSDLRQLELTEDLRRTELRLEQVEYFPTVSVFGSYTINAQQNGSPEFFGSPRVYGRSVGVRITLPIFNGFQREARIDQRRAALLAAQSQFRLAADQASVDVHSLADQVEEALLRARGQRLAVQQAQRGFEIASAQHREGLSSHLELTDAEVALRESEFNYAQAVYDYLTTRARLDEAVGRVPLVDEGSDRRGDG